MRLSLIVVLRFCIVGLDAANILFFYSPTYSHIRGPLNVASNLAAHGHVVWNALTTQLANDERLQVPGVTNLRYEALDEYDLDALTIDPVVNGYFKTGSAPFLFNLTTELCDKILRDPKLFDVIRHLNIDLIIYDASPVVRVLTVLAYKLDVPFMFMGTAFDPIRSRTPFVISATPCPLFPWTPVMDFKTRVLNTLLFTLYYFKDPFADNNIVATYAPERPYLSMETMVARASLWIVSLEPLLYYPEATVPNVKFVGTLSSGPPKELPAIYKKFMDDAKEGVVVVSFGSNVKNVPDLIFDKLVSAFVSTRYKYILKVNRTVDVGSNILLTSWMPQADLLAHPNTKLFITHCGQNGLNEAFLNGVPMIGFPICADQPHNAKRLVFKGFGLEMDLNSFQPDELTANINEVIQNSKYSDRIKKAANITKLRTRSPRDEAVYWIEHVLQYGDDHLRSYSQDMPLYQYLNLDVIGFLLFILYLSIYLIWMLFSLCIKKVANGSAEQKTKKE